MDLWIIAIILIVVSIVISVISMSMMGGKKDTNEPAKFKDFKFPIPDEGAPQAVFFGDCWTSDWQVLWVGNYRSLPIYANSSGGKK